MVKSLLKFYGKVDYCTMECRGIIIQRLKVGYLTFDEEGFATILVRDRMMYNETRRIYYSIVKC